MKDDRFGHSDDAGSNPGTPQPDKNMFGAYLENVFNSKNKVYLTIVEKTLKGILEFSDAFTKLSNLSK